MSSPSLAAIIADALPLDGGFRATIPAGWLQGRTAYGGLTSALALQAALRSDADLPPLRAANIAFVGPLAGAVTVTARRLRRGRNAAYVAVTAEGASGIGLSATFVFLAPIASSIAFDRLAPSADAPPAADARTHRGPADLFTGNFESVDIPGAPGAAGWQRWVRLVDRDGVDAQVALMAVADALPPAALQVHGRFGAVSSLTWTLNLLHPRPATHDGWWRLGAVTDRAVDGYSSQRMTVHAADGTPVADGMQGVAVFV